MKKRIILADADAGTHVMLVRVVKSEPYEVPLAESKRDRECRLPLPTTKNRYLKQPILQA